MTGDAPGEILRRSFEAGFSLIVMIKLPIIDTVILRQTIAALLVCAVTVPASLGADSCRCANGVTPCDCCLDDNGGLPSHHCSCSCCETPSLPAVSLIVFDSNQHNCCGLFLVPARTRCETFAVAKFSAGKPVSALDRCVRLSRLTL